jgi:hypothetical protein
MSPNASATCQSVEALRLGIPLFPLLLRPLPFLLLPSPYPLQLDPPDEVRRGLALSVGSGTDIAGSSECVVSDLRGVLSTQTNAGSGRESVLGDPAPWLRALWSELLRRDGVLGQGEKGMFVGELIVGSDALELVARL